MLRSPDIVFMINNIRRIQLWRLIISYDYNNNQHILNSDLSRLYTISPIVCKNYFFRLSSWEQLNDSALNFISNNSFVVEMDMNFENVVEEEPHARKRRFCSENDGLECPICYEDLKTVPLSTLLCGHLFCTS